MRGRVIPHQHGRQPGGRVALLNTPGNLIRHLRADFLGERRPIQYLCCHISSLPVKLCSV